MLVVSCAEEERTESEKRRERPTAYACSFGPVARGPVARGRRKWNERMAATAFLQHVGRNSPSEHSPFPPCKKEVSVWKWDLNVERMVATAFRQHVGRNPSSEQGTFLSM